MSRNNNQNHRKNEKRQSSCSSSSSSSSSSDDEKSNKRRDRKERRANKHCSDKRKECSPKRHSKKRSPKRESHKRHSPKRESHKKRHSKRRSPKCESPKRCESPKKCESSSSSSDSDEECEDFEKLYCYYKSHLLRDPCLMIAGSDAYADIYSTIPQDVAINTPLQYTANDPAIKHVEYVGTGGDVFVRESGIYVLSYSLETDQPGQFSIYVNNTLHPDTVTGSNSGSGQIISSVLLSLKKDDSVTVRNHTSSIVGGVVTVIQFAGGTSTQSNVQFILYKIAPHPEEHYRWDGSDYKCHEKKERLFKRLERCMLEDPCLQLEGFDAYGTFYSTLQQTIAIEAPAIFNYESDVKCLNFTLGTSQVTVTKSGVYAIYAMVSCLQAAQFAIFVNGLPLPSSVVGINKGAALLTSRSITELKCGDVVTWNNHTSIIPEITAQNPGGMLDAHDVVLQLIKIAPPSSLYPKKCEPHHCCKEERYCEPEDVREYKNFLLHRHNLQIDGADYLSVESTTQQSLNVGDPVIWKRKDFARRIQNTQGKPEIYICRDGEYNIIGSLNSSQPDQFTLYVNGKPVLPTTVGKDSGAISLALRYILRLCKGDCVTWNNWQSLVNPVITSSNAGGSEVGVNAYLIFFRLGEKWCKEFKDECKEYKGYHK